MLCNTRVQKASILRLGTLRMTGDHNGMDSVIILCALYFLYDDKLLGAVTACDENVRPC